MITIPRESVEYLPLEVAVDGDSAPSYQVAVVERGERPETWETGPYLVSGLAPGFYHAYTKVVDSPESPVYGPVTFLIT